MELKTSSSEPLKLCLVVPHDFDTLEIHTRPYAGLF